MNRNHLFIGIFAIAIIAVAVIAYLAYGPSAADDALPSSSERAGVAISPDDRTMGNPKAPIVMLEYAAPSCPHCAHFDEEVFPQLKKNYIDTGKVYYIFRVFPLNAFDGAAEAIARCLPPANYFQFIDLAFRNQTKWDPEFGVADPHAGLVQIGRIAGLSAERVDQCIGDKASAARINQVATDAETKYGVNSTPTFVVNGQVHPGAYTWDDLQTALDGMLKKK